MNNFNLISDVSVITTLPEHTLNKICYKGMECICHNVLESLADFNNETTMNIGIGDIKIIVENDEIHYRFIPCSKLESMLVQSINTKEDPLVKEIESGLATRILNTYKDLI